MKKTHANLLAFFILLGLAVAVPEAAAMPADSLSNPVGPPALADAEIQILELADEETLGEAGFAELMEMLEELRQHRGTGPDGRQPLRQQVAWRSDRCLSPQAGYARDGAFAGDAWHHVLRYRLQQRQWQVALSAEKDAGEAWRHGYPLFDALHGYVSRRSTATDSRRAGLWLRQAVVGHYRVRTGLGLMLNQQYTAGKTMLMEQLSDREGEQLSGHASTQEAHYMQGAAVQIGWGRHLRLLAFASARQVDGTMKTQQDATGVGHAVLTTLHDDGLHRTATERSHRQVSWMQHGGGRLAWRGTWAEVGVAGLYTHLQSDYRRAVSAYNVHYFRGRQLWQGAADYRLYLWRGVLSGEVAVDDGGGMAALTMLQLPRWGDCDVQLSHRYLSDRYRQLEGRSLAESSELQGEQGVSLRLSADLSPRWKLMLLGDWFHLRHPQYGYARAGQHGGEVMVRVSRQRHDSQLQLVYRLKRKNDYLRHGLDAVLTLRPGETWQLQSQLRSRLYRPLPGSAQLGVMASQQATWSTPSASAWPVAMRLTGQATWFRTDGYDSRLWLSERQVRYGFGIPMLQNHGWRLSMVAAFDARPRPSARRRGLRWGADVKYAWMRYTDRTTIGTGPLLIDGPQRHDLWLQLRASW